MSNNYLQTYLIGIFENDSSPTISILLQLQVFSGGSTKLLSLSRLKFRFKKFYIDLSSRIILLSFCVLLKTYLTDN